MRPQATQKHNNSVGALSYAAMLTNNFLKNGYGEQYCSP
jgi:hypothetical protein